MGDAVRRVVRRAGDHVAVAIAVDVARRRHAIAHRGVGDGAVHLPVGRGEQGIDDHRILRTHVVDEQPQAAVRDFEPAGQVATGRVPGRQLAIAQALASLRVDEDQALARTACAQGAVQRAQHRERTLAGGRRADGEALLEPRLAVLVPLAQAGVGVLHPLHLGLRRHGGQSLQRAGAAPGGRAPGPVPVRGAAAARLDLQARRREVEAQALRAVGGGEAARWREVEGVFARAQVLAHGVPPARIDAGRQRGGRRACAGRRRRAERQAEGDSEEGERGGKAKDGSAADGGARHGRPPGEVVGF